jgi:acyl carrier protein
MTLPPIEAQVREIIAVISRQDLASVRIDDSLVEVLGVDSLQGLQILAAVEKRFGIRLPDEELIRMRTIGAIVAAVAQLRQESVS